MKLQITGEIDIIRPIEHKGKFKKLEFSIFTPEANYYGMQANNNNAYWLSDYKKGDIVKIDFELKGNPWGGKVFNNLLVEKITLVDGKGTQAHQESKKALKEFNRNRPKVIKVNLK